MSGARNYLIVTASYWSFTLTYGALRMLSACLYFDALGYTPFMLAFGLLSVRNGRHLRQSRRRLAGDALWHSTHARVRPRAQIERPRYRRCSLRWSGPGARLCPLPGWSWRKASPVVAKDMTKTASKWAIKATSEGRAGQLFRWVAWCPPVRRTRCRSALGFSVGGFLVDTAGFHAALWLMAAMLAVVLANQCPLSRPTELGKAKASKLIHEPFAKSLCDRPARWRARASFCSDRATSGLSSGCRFFSTHRAGSTWKFVVNIAASAPLATDLSMRIAPMVVRRSCWPDGLSRETPRRVDGARH